ncbi:nuclear transport factor 2 family protein [Burkholderia pseudomultivorans]|uniref:nuclear transport factor 2 family protein n=1 Tax=Burkholderia pseudomultivorans TaxID=1207504 RepID=UPI002874AD86|nr:nuclear transport factor 2 family protein [Burkholderia pseudomultivorans]MDS0858644.1 nuclear transport factor 2 family protein [Burkholderia pseudomultivorans]
MNNEDVRAIERLMSDFAWFADRGEGESMGQLFVPDGVLHVGGIILSGRDAIASDCKRRHTQPGRKTRHLWSNLRVNAVDANRSQSSAVQITFEHHSPDGLLQVRVNDVFDRLRRAANGGWLIEERIIQPEIAF